ncbi:protease SohB [Aidingimonas halophila]|uniref:Serine protease SohB n=1 Tax=Aidingimonas halophila TaxID=574349 RepID=A0A1H3BHL8_9GAMM|nr:protease SohB [Aidingimonas halophila]GHC26463.1 protease [Aidingimonas halophila]SDX40854.1 serine protease SohB [Aidingimonas halophila]
MNEWLNDFAMFLAQILTLLVALVVAIALVTRSRSMQGGEKSRLRVEDLNQRYRKRYRQLRLSGLTSKARKSMIKAFRKEDKLSVRRRSEESADSRVWVLDFHGDLKASATSRLSQEVSTLLGIAGEGDEVVLRLESAGGLVHAYGQAAAEFDRLRESGIHTTVCVDKVAASGGYLMACCAERLIVAPFAVLGSIGVVAQLPNVHRLLKRHDIDVEVMTAGRYKRTLTVLGENTDEGREKFRGDLQHIHDLFKQYVGQRRPGLDIDSVATGEVWYGTDAVENGLADAVKTSEAYLLERMQQAKVMTLQLETRKGVAARMGLALEQGVERGVQRAIEAVDATRWLKR